MQPIPNIIINEQVKLPSLSLFFNLYILPIFQHQSKNERHLLNTISAISSYQNTLLIIHFLTAYLNVLHKLMFLDHLFY